MKDFTAKQSIRDSREVSTTNIYYTSIHLKLRNLADDSGSWVGRGHVIAIIQ